MSDATISFIIWTIATLFALSCIMSMSTALKDRLQGLLVAYVKKQQADLHKMRRIKELRMKIRQKKLIEAQSTIEENESAKSAAPTSKAA